MPLYPLKFIPRFVEKMWGGRKLQSVLGKSLPPGKPIGESWELYDFPPGIVSEGGEWVSSVVANGPLAGRTLHQLMLDAPDELLGDVRPVGPHAQFPLLIKFLDAREDLSVQVHPDQRYADANPHAHLKTEAWYILQHDPDARLFHGLRPGVTPGAFRDAISAGTVERLLRALPVRRGQCHYLPSGTVHALGAGILAAEVQTPSDTTFRVFDFNRVDPSTGKPRALHVEQAMQCIDFNATPHEPSAQDADTEDGVKPIVQSPFFSIRRRALPQNREIMHAGGKPTILIMLEGGITLRGNGFPADIEIAPGETMLVPACVREAAIHASADSRWLEVCPSSSAGS